MNLPLRAATLAAILALGSSPARAQTRPPCQSCHGELEFLRQQVEDLDQARALLAPVETLRASAHGALTCSDCHTGFTSFPHGTAVSTSGCASCHEEQSAAWDEGVHALDETGSCGDCHGVHDVATLDVLRSPEGTGAMREACTTCHFEQAMPENDPHAESVSCVGCHEPHRMFPPEDERSSVHVMNQGTTCGGCHEEPAALWTLDSHGEAVPLLAHPGGRVPEGASRSEPPACTACHGAHGMLTRSEAGFGAEMAGRCAHCHEPYAESFADSYHGQATTLGSANVATCYSCHGAHGVYPADDPESAVGEARLLDTCQGCHPDATAGFTLFQPHADHNDRENYPFVYWSYHLMSALLLGVFTVFGLHTALWLARLGLDALRGAPHTQVSSGDRP